MTERTVRLTPAPPERPDRSVVVFERRPDGARSGRIRTGLPRSLAEVVAEQELVGAGPPGLPARMVVFRDGDTAGSREYAPRMRYRDLEGSAAEIAVAALDAPRGGGSLWADAERLDRVLDAWTWVLPGRAEAAWVTLHATLLRDFHSRRLLTGRREVLVLAVRRFLDRNGSVRGSLLVELLTDLWLWHVLEQARVAHGGDPDAPGSVRAIETVRRYCQEHAATSASNIWSGYLATLRADRTACASFFDRARREDRTGQFLENFSLRGLNTYLVRPGAAGGPPVRDTGFVPVVTAGATGAPAIVHAGDVRFFRRYFSRLYFHGRLMRRTPLHFHVVGPREEVDRAFADAHALAAATDRIAADGRAGEWGLSTEELPPSVADPVTYYACVRFVRFAQLLGLYPGGLWIQDMDLVQTGAVEGYIDRLAGHDIGVVRSAAGFGCTPWKSVLGGNVWVADTRPARSFMQDAVDYMEANWTQPSAWMLDQNALRFASDRADPRCRVLDLSELRLPLGQNSLASLIEA